jgi:hypothetical protein
MTALSKGIRVEMEHAHLFPKGSRRKMARLIAMDHLREDPMYYVKLMKMENRRNACQLHQVRSLRSRAGKPTRRNPGTSYTVFRRLPSGMMFKNLGILTTEEKLTRENIHRVLPQVGKILGGAVDIHPWEFAPGAIELYRVRSRGGRTPLRVLPWAFLRINQ